MKIGIIGKLNLKFLRESLKYYENIIHHSKQKYLAADCVKVLIIG